MKEKNDYPMILNVDHICDILLVSRPTAYDIMGQEGFPLMQNIGNSKRTPRDLFFKWIEDGINEYIAS